MRVRWIILYQLLITHNVFASTHSKKSSETKQSSPPVSNRAESLKKVESSVFSSPASPFNSDRIKIFISSRCSNPLDNRKKSSIWVYEGFLIDPFNGRRIAEVEGLESVRYLTDNYPLPKKGVVENMETKGNSDTISPDATPKRKKKRLSNLLVAKVLFPPSQNPSQKEDNKNEPPSWDHATTVLSRKLFCYRDPQDRRKLLSSIRIRPGVGKVRKLKLEESVALYDTATTFISRDNGNEMSVHTEWSDGRTILANSDKGLDKSDWRIKTEGKEPFMSDLISPVSNNNDNNNFEYSVYAKGQKNTKSKSSMDKYIQKLIPTKRQVLYRQNLKNKSGEKSGINTIHDINTISPARTKFIQFGREDKDTENNKYGVRETYSYSWDSIENSSRLLRPLVSLTENSPLFVQRACSQISKTLNKAESFVSEKMTFFKKNEADNVETSVSSGSECSVRYTRYGECPPWYGPGRMCTLELVGRKVPSFSHAPPLAASIAAEKVPGFTTVNHPICPLSLTSDSLVGKGKYGFSKSKKMEQDPNKREIYEKLYDRAAKKAVKWFRKDSETLRLVSNDDGDSIFQQIDNQRLKGLWNKGETIIQKLKSATTTVN